MNEKNQFSIEHGVNSENDDIVSQYQLSINNFNSWLRPNETNVIKYTFRPSSENSCLEKFSSELTLYLFP